MARITSPFGRAAGGVIVDRTNSRSAMRSSAAVAGGVVVILLVLSAVVNVYLAQLSSIASSGYQLEQLEAERKEWVARNGQLELEIAKRHSLVWSETEAVERMGMARNDKPAFVPVDRSMFPCNASAGQCPGQSGGDRAVGRPSSHRSAAAPGGFFQQIGQQIGDALSSLRRSAE